MQGRKAAARRQRDDEARHAKGNRRTSVALLARHALETRPGAVGDRDRKQESRPAKQHEQRAREIGTEQADQVTDLTGLARVAEARVEGIETCERDEEYERKRCEQPEDRLAQRACEN